MRAPACRSWSTCTTRGGATLTRTAYINVVDGDLTDLATYDGSTEVKEISGQLGVSHTYQVACFTDAGNGPASDLTAAGGGSTTVDVPGGGT